VNSSKRFRTIAGVILKSAIHDNFRGSDPYDGLNSKLLSPFIRRSRLFRLALIQLVKRCPLNLRPFLRIRDITNPKGLALFLSGISDFPEIDKSGELKEVLGDSLLSMASKTDGSAAFVKNRKPISGIVAGIAENISVLSLGWGYSFPWQSRAFLQPAWFPTVVCTNFVLDSLSDSANPAVSIIAGASAQFVTRSLKRYEDDTGICFSYSPDDRTRVFNASLFGAKILANAAQYSEENRKEWTALAQKAVEYVIARQNDDGSWFYGEDEHWQWIDNLHTGFILESLADISKLLGTSKWDDCITSGLSYYRDVLFEPDGTAKYYATRKYPLDPHSFAQGAITFLKLTDYYPDGRETAKRILNKGIDFLWDEVKSGFIFQRHRWHKNPVVHMRWSQAWMFRALCLYLKGNDENLV